jgi:hypothetical protein
MVSVQDPEFVVPKDWPPLDGEIDLIEQDLPHDSSATEVCLSLECFEFGIDCAFCNSGGI